LRTGRAKQMPRRSLWQHVRVVQTTLQVRRYRGDFVEIVGLVCVGLMCVGLMCVGLKGVGLKGVGLMLVSMCVGFHVCWFPCTQQYTTLTLFTSVFSPVAFAKRGTIARRAV
jgi:hypothetical protein